MVIEAQQPLKGSRRKFALTEWVYKTFGSEAIGESHVGTNHARTVSELSGRFFGKID